MGRIFKSLFRRGEANGIKIFCLGVGLAIGLTLLAEVIFERSYDDFIPRLEDTYRVESNFLGKDNDGWRGGGGCHTLYGLYVRCALPVGRQQGGSR